MSEAADNEKPYGLIQIEPSSRGDELEPRDYIFALDVDFDVNAQLMAIGGLLHRNRNADKLVDEEIRKLEEQIKHLKDVEQQEWAVSDWVNQVVHSTYQDAAHSMAAVGMLAPLVETIFFQCFQRIGKRFFPLAHPFNAHARWNSTHTIQWDCHYVVTDSGVKKSIVEGIFQLSDAVGLTERFPSDLRQVLSVLFAYRNKMFHCGFEWPAEEREDFAKRIKKERWNDDWFSIATTDGKPWVFSLSDKYIRHCDKTIEEVLQVIGGFVRDELLKESDKKLTQPRN